MTSNPRTHNRLLLIFSLFLAFCGIFALSPHNAAAAQKIRLACLGGSSAAMMEFIKKGVAEKGLEVELVVFRENQLPATALAENEVDGFITNQIVWVNAFNKRKGTDLRMLKPYIFYPGYAAYSTKYKSINELPDKARVAMPGDPSNLERCLLVMQAMGLIELGEKNGEFYNRLDIIKNPKNISILETEITATPRNINDVDMVICTSNGIMEAGYDPRAYLFEDPNAKNFPVSLVVQPKDVDAPWAKTIMDYTQTDSFRNDFNNLFKGARVLYDKVQ